MAVTLLILLLKFSIPVIILLLASQSVQSQTHYSNSLTTYTVYGLSGDTKPLSPPDNCYFVERNTGNTYVSISGIWTSIGLGVASIASTYLQKVDTASMLTNYARSNVVALKVAIADTAGMLTNYAKSAAVALKVAIADTATMLSNYAKSAAVALKLSIADTSAQLNPYLRKIDTASLSSRITQTSIRLFTSSASTLS